MKKAFLVLALLLIAATPSMGQETVHVLLGKASGEKKVELYVSVLDEAGRPVKGLKAQDFDLQVSGVAMDGFSVQPISTSQEALSVVLGMDISGSMKGKPFIETKRALSVFLDQLDRTDFISLMSFGTEVRFLTDFINDKPRVRSQVENLRAADQWTHLYDAVCEALVQAKKSPTTRVAILLLTDGRDEGSQHSRQTTLDMSTGASIPVFLIGFGHAINRDDLTAIAQSSQGYALFTPQPEKIPDLYGVVLDQLKSQYVISFDFTRNPGPYKVNLVLHREGRTAWGGKEFLFNPTGAPLTVQTEIVKIPPLQPQPPQPPPQDWIYFIAGGIVLLLILALIAHILVRISARKSPLADPGWKPVRSWLEYPKDYGTVLKEPSISPGSGTRVSTTADAFLRVETSDLTVALVFDGVECIEELIVAQHSLDSEAHKAAGKTYLWTEDQTVSRPKDGRAGHMRIFTTSSERFAAEDLGSLNGTLLNGKEIKGKGIAVLEDGDVLDVGGKQGLKIIYREGQPEKAIGQGAAQA